MLGPPRAEWHDRQGWAGTTMSGAGKPGDGGADDRCLDDVVMAAHSRRAVLLTHPHLHAGDHHALGAELPDVIFQRSPVRSSFAQIPRFITVRAAAYFFIPSMTSLRFLASGDAVRGAGGR